MTKDEALRLALEALEYMDVTAERYVDKQIPKKAITAIKEALANEALEKMAENARELGLDYEPEQEPVAFVKGWNCGRLEVIVRSLNQRFEIDQPLYTTPPQRKPLTIEQPKVRTGDCLLVGVCASEGHKIPPQRTWAGLTDKDWNRSKHNYDFQKGVDWAESILKEKNA